MGWESLKKHIEARENKKAKKAFGKGGSKPTKYRAVSCEEDGFSFQSQLERAVYRILKLRVHAGEISDLKVQQRVYLLRNPDIYYIADFSANDDQTHEKIWIESKGYETSEWLLKRKLWIHFGPGRLEVYKGDHARPFLHEVIVPLTGGL